MHWLRNGAYSIVAVVMAALAIMGLLAAALVWLCRLTFTILSEDDAPPVGWDYDRFPKGPKA